MVRSGLGRTSRWLADIDRTRHMAMAGTSVARSWSDSWSNTDVRNTGPGLFCICLAGWFDYSAPYRDTTHLLLESKGSSRRGRLDTKINAAWNARCCGEKTCYSEERSAEHHSDFHILCSTWKSFVDPEFVDSDLSWHNAVFPSDVRISSSDLHAVLKRDVLLFQRATYRPDCWGTLSCGKMRVH